MLSPTVTLPSLPLIVTALAPSPAFISAFVPSIPIPFSPLPAVIFPVVPSTVTALVSSVPKVTLSANLTS